MFVEIRKIDGIDLNRLTQTFERIIYKENDLYVKIYISNIDEIYHLKNELLQIYSFLYFNEPVDNYGCCSRYVECSDALKCINPDKKLARGCQYKNNLEAGKIFFGKNKILKEVKMKENARKFKGNSLLNTADTYVLVDIETTGFSPQYDEIIEIGAIKVENNKIVDEYQSLININEELSPMISNLTGITTEMLENGKNYSIVLNEFLEFAGDNILVAHNANFDINFLYDKSELYINKYLKNDFIDTMRIAKKLLPNLPNYKLSTLADNFAIDYSNAHRGLADVKITFEIYNKLKYYEDNYYEIKMSEIENSIRVCEEYNNKKVVVKTTLQNLDYKIIKAILEKQHTKTYDIFYSFCDYLIVNDSTYEKYQNMDNVDMYYGEWLYKAKSLENSGTLKVISESDFCKALNIPFTRKVNIKKERTSAKDIIPQTENFDETHPLYSKNCVFTGVLEKMERKQAMQIVVNLGGICEDRVTNKTNFLILGNNDYCKSIKDGKSSKQKKAEELKIKGNDIEIISENVFYDMISDN